MIKTLTSKHGHPSDLLQSAWVDLLRQESDNAAAIGQLTQKQLQLFYDQGWFKALVPQNYGGLQWSLSELARFEEAIGWAEGSAGWVFTLCSGAGWFGGYMDPDFAAGIFKKENACLAGSGAVGGIASGYDNGQWIVSGQWRYATGAPHATAFTANIYLEDQSIVRPVVLLPEEINIEKSWNPIGLVASASESFSCSNIVMTPQRAFDINPDKPRIEAPLYRLPFGPLAEATIAANLSGMCLHFMEEVEKFWDQDTKTERLLKLPEGPDADRIFAVNDLLDYFGREWQQARTSLYSAVEELESYVKTHMWVVNISRAVDYVRMASAVSAAAQQLAALCRTIVNEIYPYTGLKGATVDSAVSKVWRDFQTGSQHGLFRPEIRIKKKR